MVVVFTEEELRILIERFVIPFLSINNDKIDDKIIYEKLDNPLIKRFIEYDDIKKTMSFYPSDGESDFRFSINCEFNKKIRIVRDVMSYVVLSKEGYDKRFVNQYFDFLIEEGFINWLSLRKEDLSKTLKVIIDGLKKWMQQTFEGEKKSFVIGIDLHNDDTSGLKINDIIGNSYFATITEAYNSAIIVNKYGVIVKYVSDIIPDLSNEDIEYVLPAKCESIIRKLYSSGSEIVLSLENSGDLLIYKIDYKGTEKKKKKDRNIPQMKIVLAHRGGHWLNYDSVNFQNAIHGSIGDKDINILHSAILDVSLEHSGGSIAILDGSRNHLDLVDILSDIDNLEKDWKIGSEPKLKEKDQKRMLIEKLLIEDGKKISFFNMDRHKRLELLSMDGATIIDRNGQIISVGAIINGVEPSEDGGARTASVKKLSQYGTAIKISTDGGISVYKNNEIKFKM
jgi:hypothetical protein